jgi:hypothetical protein
MLAAGFAAMSPIGLGGNRGELCSRMAAAANAPLIQSAFMTPSHNIRCLADWAPGRGLLYCVIESRIGGWIVSARGPVKTFSPCDPLVDRAPVLPYGQTWNRGVFTCLSRRIGVRCHSRVSGHGFFLSRQVQRVF